MPFSHSGQLTAIVQEIERIAPASMLDVGTGMGQYGFLARMNLENINLFTIDGDKGTLAPRSQWRTRIDGIEGFVEYLTPVHQYVYDDLLVGEALSLLGTIPDGTYELVIAIDILEHFSAQEGLQFLKAIKRVSSRNVIVSTPKEFIEQEVAANPLENHRSLWSLGDLEAEGFTRVLPDLTSWITVYEH